MHRQSTRWRTASTAAPWCRTGSGNTRRRRSCRPIACYPVDVKAFEGTNDFLGFVYAGEQVQIGWRDIAFVEQKIEINYATPECTADQHHRNTLHLFGLDQGEHLEQLIERSIATGEGHQALGVQQEVHLAQREIVESERQIWAHVGVGCLFVGQRDVEANRTCADLESTAVGGLHDAGPTPGDDDEITAVLLLETRRNQARETPRLLVVTCLFDPAIGSGKLLPQPDILRSDARLTLQHAKTGFCRLGIAHACAAEDHYRRANALLAQDALRFEQFEL